MCRVFGEAAQPEFRSHKVLGRGQSFNVESGRVVQANDSAGAPANAEVGVMSLGFGNVADAIGESHGAQVVANSTTFSFGSKQISRHDLYSGYATVASNATELTAGPTNLIEASFEYFWPNIPVFQTPIPPPPPDWNIDWKPYN